MDRGGTQIEEEVCVGGGRGGEEGGCVRRGDKRM